MIVHSKQKGRVNIDNTTYPEKNQHLIQSIRTEPYEIQTESVEGNWNASRDIMILHSQHSAKTSTNNHWLVRGKHHSNGTCNWCQALCSHHLQRIYKSKEHEYNKSDKTQSPTNSSPICTQLLSTSLPDHPDIVWHRTYHGHVRWNQDGNRFNNKENLPLKHNQERS